MGTIRGWLRAGISVAVACSSSLAGCSRTSIVLACQASRPAVKDIIAIHATVGTAEDLTLIPPRQGTLEISGAAYTIRFKKFSAGNELRFVIDRFTTGGTRQVVDPASGEPVLDSLDAVVCKPYRGRKI